MPNTRSRTVCFDVCTLFCNTNDTILGGIFKEKRKGRISFHRLPTFFAARKRTSGKHSERDNMNFDSPQPSSTYPPREQVCSSVLIDLPTNPEFTELIKRKSEKLLFHKAQIREGSSPNPVPMSCILVLNNDRNERLKLKINNEIVWKNDGVPIIAADLGGDALVKGLSCGMRSGADYVVGDMDSSSSPSSSSPSFDEKVRKKRRTLAQMKRGEGNDEKMPFVNREQVRKRRFDDSDDTASGDNDDDKGVIIGECIDLSRDQDTNDMEKCLNFILERGKQSHRDPIISDVVIFNAMGGRFDHEFANISAILKAPGLLKGGPSYVCYDAYDNGAKEQEKLGVQISFPIRRGYTVLKFKVPAKSLGLIPFNGKTKVWTNGLKWNLGNEKKDGDNADNNGYIEMGQKISSSNETTFEDNLGTNVTDVHVKCDKDIWFTARIR